MAVSFAFTKGGHMNEQTTSTNELLASIQTRIGAYERLLSGTGASDAQAPSALIPRLALKPNEAAIATGRSRSRIYELLSSGEIRAVKDGASTLIPTTELARWLATLPAAAIAA